MGRITGRFARVEPRLRAGRLMLGLLSDLPRKNCWTIAEWAGEKSPHGMRHLLCRASWDSDAVRDDVREYVVEHLHDEGVRVEAAAVGAHHHVLPQMVDQLQGSLHLTAIRADDRAEQGPRPGRKV